MIAAFRQFIGQNSMLAYLVMMTPRLVELKRVLKPTGSLYLHCDPTASHYLKLLLDAVFGARSFRNEIIWRRANAHNDPKRYRTYFRHHSLSTASRTNDAKWNTGTYALQRGILRLSFYEGQ